MASNNPWANAQSQGNPYVSPTSDSNQEQSQSYYQPHQAHSEQHHEYQQQQSAPSQGIRRSDTEQLLEQQEDGAAQVEHMQQYEAQSRQTEDDKVQAQLQKEFPNIDSSLIAAIYNERKAQGNAALGEVREMLQELNSS